MRILHLALLAATVVTGCTIRLPGAERHVAAREVKVHRPPPAKPYAVVVKGARPDAHHVWVAGHWVHRGDRYARVAGRWARPPRGKRVWVAGRWKRTGRGGVWVAGRWS